MLECLRYDGYDWEPALNGDIVETEAGTTIHWHSEFTSKIPFTGWLLRRGLTRVLLTLMVSAGLEAESTRSRRVLVSYRGDEAVVTVRVCRDETEGGVEREEDDDILRLDASAAGEAALAMDGELTVTRDQVDGTCYDLRLPTLIEARRASGGR